MSKGRPRFPCRCCFLECEPVYRGKKPYPCTEEMRLLARAHRNDRGDELGYVREAMHGDRRRA